ncbi:MAG: GNAT family N-acetyltransferase [Thermoleophilaceae bacterium]
MWEPLFASMRHWNRVVAASSPGARVLERDGVAAAIVPAAPERAVVNGVLYESAAGLAAAYKEIAAAYAAIDAAWTVWVPPADEHAAGLLEEAGHVLDAQPQAMALDLTAGVERPSAGALEHWTANGDVAEVGPLNDRAYDFGTDSFTRALGGVSADGLFVYLARRGGRAVGCAIVADQRGNAGVEMVAVAPEARGHGVSGELLGHALADAAERGIESSTLVATRLGRPVYERLGYRSFGSLQMWERRDAGAPLT